MIGQPAMMGGVSMAAMMNPQVPLLMGGAPQLQGQMNPSLYNIQQVSLFQALLIFGKNI